MRAHSKRKAQKERKDDGKPDEIEAFSKLCGIWDKSDNSFPYVPYTRCNTEIAIDLPGILVYKAVMLLRREQADIMNNKRVAFFGNFE